MTTQAIDTSVDLAQREQAEDIFFGQVVINWARWFVVAAGVALVMILMTESNELAVGILPIVGLMVVNFYLHGRRLAQKPANRVLVAASSVLDLAVITAVIAIGPGHAGTGLANQFYVAYFPVIAAFGFVMPRKFTIVYVLTALFAYAATCLAIDPSIINPDSVEGIRDWTNLESLVTRLIVIGAVGGLASFFWRVQRERRHLSGRWTNSWMSGE